MPSSAPRHKPTGPKTPRHEAKGANGSWREGLTTAERGYGGRWQKARETFLGRPENVLCRMCHEEGFITLAKVVDHIEPHRGDQALFWDTSNWQPLCKTCHDSRKQAIERGTLSRETIREDG